MAVSLIEFSCFIPNRDPVASIVSFEGDDTVACDATTDVLSSGGADTVSKSYVLGEPSPRPIFREIYWRGLEWCFWLLLPDHVFFPECRHVILLKYGTFWACGFFCGPVGL